MVTYLFTSTLDLKKGNNKGVVLHILLLNEIIKEKSMNALLKTGSISMSGKSTVLASEVEKKECEIDFDETDIERGDIKVIVVHAKSFSVKKGQKS